MKESAKYIGIIIILMGVSILAIPKFLNRVNNTWLLTGLLTMVIGIIVFIYINRRIR